MTEIAFHFNVSDKLGYACRLLRKAYASGAQVAVTAEADVLGELDQLLWSFSSTEFVPHCRPTGGTGSMLSRSVLLVDTPADCAHHGVLVNLGMQVPAEFERFDRFIELVSQDGDERLGARARWKYYSDRGYSMLRHDTTASGEGT